jgi:hypothetical protein
MAAYLASHTFTAGAIGIKTKAEKRKVLLGKLLIKAPADQHAIEN